MDAYGQFVSMPAATSSTEFDAIDLSQVRRDFLAKAQDGSPVILLHDASSAKYTPGLSLTNLMIEFHVTCRVKTRAGSIDDQFAVITCDAAVPELYELFVRCK